MKNLKTVNASAEIEYPVNLDEETRMNIYKQIESAGRTCYKSEDKITDNSAEKFVRNLIKRGHYSPLEHVVIRVRFIVDRGVSHEIVRHRIASYSQESSRYCRYSDNKFGNEVTFISPYEDYIAEIKDVDKLGQALRIWEKACAESQDRYMELIELGVSPQLARGVLNHSVKTELVATMNLREWREVFKQRCSSAAHPQMQDVMTPLFYKMCDFLPAVFDDMKEHITD